MSEEENLVKEIRDIRDECEVLANRLEAIAVKIKREQKKEAKIKNKTSGDFIPRSSMVQ